MNATVIPDNQNPVDEAEREAVLAAPLGHAPSYDDLLEAVKAYMMWHIAEDKNLGTFHAKMDLCSYAEWAAKKALGLPHEPEWRGVPRIVITMGEAPNAPPGSLHPVVQPTRPWTHEQESEEMLRNTGGPEIRACVDCGENAPEHGLICDECLEQNSLL